jgi:hypothetical protein
MAFRLNRLPVPLAATLAVAATLAYAMASGYISAGWSALTANPEYAGRLTAATIRPWGKNPETYLWHWHALAFASLLLNGWWARNRLQAGADPAAAIGAPLACHATWLLFAFLAHVTGFLASVVDVIYVLE